MYQDPAEVPDPVAPEAFAALNAAAEERIEESFDDDLIKVFKCTETGKVIDFLFVLRTDVT